MEFIIKELEEKDWFINGDYRISRDSSILFSSFGGGFQLLLGNGYHFSMDIDCETGRCFSFYTLLEAIKKMLRYENITLPKYKQAKLYFLNDNILGGSGCHYTPFDEKCYWDKINKILCIGDKNAEGETIEFATGTYAKIKNKHLLAIYLKLNFEIYRRG